MPLKGIETSEIPGFLFDLLIAEVLSIEAVLFCTWFIAFCHWCCSDTMNRNMFAVELVTEEKKGREWVYSRNLLRRRKWINKGREWVFCMIWWIWDPVLYHRTHLPITLFFSCAAKFLLATENVILLYNFVTLLYLRNLYSRILYLNHICYCNSREMLRERSIFLNSLLHLSKKEFCTWS